MTRGWERMECKSDLKSVVPFSSSFSSFSHLLSPFPLFSSFPIPLTSRKGCILVAAVCHRTRMVCRPLVHFLTLSIHPSSFILTLKWFHPLSLSLFDSIQFNSLSVSLSLPLTFDKLAVRNETKSTRDLKYLLSRRFGCLEWKQAEKTMSLFMILSFFLLLSLLLPSLLYQAHLSLHPVYGHLSLFKFLPSLCIPCFHLNWNKEEEFLSQFSRIVFSKFEKEKEKRKAVWKEGTFLWAEIRDGVRE